MHVYINKYSHFYIMCSCFTKWRFTILQRETFICNTNNTNFPSYRIISILETRTCWGTQIQSWEQPLFAISWFCDVPNVLLCWFHAYAIFGKLEYISLFKNTLVHLNFYLKIDKSSFNFCVINRNPKVEMVKHLR